MKAGYVAAGIVTLVIAAVLAAVILLHSNPSAGRQPTTSAFSGPSSSKIPAAYSINLDYSPAVGNYLANATGWTLYLYMADKPHSGKSACYSSCATYWPPFYASNLRLPEGLNASDFGVINRTDGTRQLTYMGWPLYYYAGDRAAGQINGDDINSFGGLWFVVNSTTINYK